MLLLFFVFLVIVVIKRRTIGEWGYAHYEKKEQKKEEISICYTTLEEVIEANLKVHTELVNRSNTIFRKLTNPRIAKDLVKSERILLEKELRELFDKMMAIDKLLLKVLNDPRIRLKGEALLSLLKEASRHRVKEGNTKGQWKSLDGDNKERRDVGMLNSLAGQVLKLAQVYDKPVDEETREGIRSAYQEASSQPQLSKPRGLKSRKVTNITEKGGREIIEEVREDTEPTAQEPPVHKTEVS